MHNIMDHNQDPEFKQQQDDEEPPPVIPVNRNVQLLDTSSSSSTTTKPVVVEGSTTTTSSSSTSKGGGVVTTNSLDLRKIPPADILLRTVAEYPSQHESSSDCEDDNYNIYNLKRVKPNTHHRGGKKNNRKMVKNGNNSVSKTTATRYNSSEDGAGGNNNNNNNNGSERIVRISTNVSSINDDGTTTEHNNNDYYYGDKANNNTKSSTTSSTKCSSLGSIVSMCFLNPKHRMKTQLMISFGTVNILTILIIIATCMGVGTYLGDTIKGINQNAFERKLVPEVQSRAVRYLAESLEQQLMPLNMISIIVEATMDRFQGYPTTLWSEHQQVPFRDVISKKFVYPIINDEPMLLNWQIPSDDITEENYHEHVQQLRWDHFYKYQTASTTANAVFHMQGTCDPNVTDVTEQYYFDNCTFANNDVTTGGVINPVPSTYPIYQKGKDLIPVLKAVFESKKEIQDLGIYFANMGAGATISFPAYPLNTQSEYESIGCDWMKELNPFDPRLGPIATDEEIERCHESGTMVPTTLYNPMEAGPLCRKAALNPHLTIVDSIEDSWNPGVVNLFMVRAIYDRQTKAFIGCGLMANTLSMLDDRLQEYVVGENSAISLVKFDDVGTVLASTTMRNNATRQASNSSDDTTSSGTSGGLPTIEELNVGISRESYQDLYTMVQYDSLWDPHHVRQQYASYSRLEDQYLVAVAPIPRVPDEYDPDYKPEWLAVVSMSTDYVFRGVDNLDEQVNDHLRKTFQYALIVAVVGCLLATMVIIFVSNTLTAPLHYINDATDQIVKGIGDKKEKNRFSYTMGRTNSNEIDEEADDAKDESKSNNRNDELLQTNSIKSEYVPPACSPDTELTDVMNEFNKMVEGFSGSMLAKSEKSKRVEVRNRFDLRMEFSDLYASRKDPAFKYTLDVGQYMDEEDEYDEYGFAHFSSVLTKSGQSVCSSSKSIHFIDTSKPKKRWWTSRLFLWTVALIVTPLLLTTVTISAAVMNTIRIEFDEGVDSAKDYFVRVELFSLQVYAKHRAELVAEMVAWPVRDLYLITRYYHWLFFGGVARADSYTEMVTAADACKIYEEPRSECPEKEEIRTCDCQWNIEGATCQEYPEGSRHLQRAHYTVEASDALPDGDRNITRYPEHSTSPSTTSFWSDMTTLPGWEKGSSAAGHDTLYDRLRVTSAMPLLPVLYNYVPGGGTAKYLGFEADGLFVGYEGCDGGGALGSFWVANEGAAALRPELCPVGKHGYDPR